mmetsp:Transcript_54762/g.168743  ORF Transcript_54762/g.168743 Transcript_54762/m.168743 type:complete len:375 (-) Transcript_54762:117-1241(-)
MGLSPRRSKNSCRSASFQASPSTWCTALVAIRGCVAGSSGAASNPGAWTATALRRGELASAKHRRYVQIFDNASATGIATATKYTPPKPCTSVAGSGGTGAGNSVWKYATWRSASSALACSAAISVRALTSASTTSNAHHAIQTTATIAALATHSGHCKGAPPAATSRSFLAVDSARTTRRGVRGVRPRRDDATELAGVLAEPPPSPARAAALVFRRRCRAMYVGMDDNGASAIGGTPSVPFGAAEATSYRGSKESCGVCPRDDARLLLPPRRRRTTRMYRRVPWWAPSESSWSTRPSAWTTNRPPAPSRNVSATGDAVSSSFGGDGRPVGVLGVGMCGVKRGDRPDVAADDAAVLLASERTLGKDGVTASPRT